MNELEIVQHSGPEDKSPESYAKWYDDILKAANRMRIKGESGIEIKKELEPEENQAYTYDPFTRTYHKAGFKPRQT